MKHKLALLLSMSMSFSMFLMPFSSHVAIAANDEITTTSSNRLSEIQKIKMEIKRELVHKETVFKEAEAKLQEAKAKLKKATDKVASSNHFTREDQLQENDASEAVTIYQEAYDKAKDELDKVKKMVTQVVEQETIEINEFSKQGNKEVSFKDNLVSDDVYKMLDSIQIKIDKAREAQNKLMERLGDALNKASDLSYAENDSLSGHNGDHISEAKFKKYTDYNEKLAKKIEDMNMMMEQFLTNLNEATQAGLGGEIGSSNGDKMKRKVETPKTVDNVSVLKQAEEKVNQTRELLIKATEEKNKLFVEEQAADEEAEQARQNLVRAEARAAKAGQSKDDSNEVKLARIAKERADQTLAKLKKAQEDAVEQYQKADLANRDAEYKLTNAKIEILSK